MGRTRIRTRMVESIRIRGFKSILDATVSFAPLTLLVGTNASGKSNLLEAVQLLAWTASGQRLGELPHAMRQGTLGVRGSVADLRPLGGGGGPVCFDVVFSTTPTLGTLRLHLGLAVDGGEVSVLEETLTAPELPETNLPLYRTSGASSAHGHDLTVEYNNFARGKKPVVNCVDERPVFTQLVSPARFDRKHKASQERIPAANEVVRSGLQSILFLDPDPRSMRSYAFREEHRLQADGGNVSAVLWNLCEDPGRKGELLAFIERIPDHEIVGLGFLTTPRNEVMVVLTERFSGVDHDVAAALLSDGTLRVFAIAAALLSVPEGSIVVIEEIDNGVHPSRASHLLAQIDAIASRRSLRVLITTHNPALQDELPRDALESVMVAYRDAAAGGTRVVRLGELPAFPELVIRGPLGQLVTRRSLDRYLPGHAGEAPPPVMDLGFLDEVG